MSDQMPVKTVAEALTGLHYGHQDDEGYQQLIEGKVFEKDAEVALASLAQHRDDFARVYADHEPVECSHARAGEPVQRWWLCEACGWESPHRADALLNEEKYGHGMDAVLAFLTGGAR